MLDIQDLAHHLPEAALERYLLHQSPESEIETVETHFLACASCIERLEDMRLQIAAIKIGLQELHLEKVARSFENRGRGIRWFSFRGVSGLSAAAAAVAILLAIAIPEKHVPGGRPNVDFKVTAYRGVESAVLPLKNNMHVTLNAYGLGSGEIKVTLVDSDGHELWSAVSEIRDGQVVLDVPEIRTPGTHFFRLYTADQAPELMREFAVRFEQATKGTSLIR